MVCNGKTYKVNFKALKCAKKSIIIPNTIRGVVLGISEYNQVYVRKIFFAGTSNEWNALEGVGYIRMQDELITIE